GYDETEPFEEDETAVTPPPPRHYGSRISAPLGHRAAMIHMRDDVLEEDMPPRRRFVLTAPSPGCYVAESSAAAARAPRSQYDFVDIVEAGQALQASKQWMMTFIDEVNLRVSYQAQVRRQESVNFYTQLLDAQTDRRDIRLEIDGLIRSPGHDTRTIARAADKAEDVGHVRALQASDRRMMTSIEEVNLRVSYQAQ
nr:hypothetical protein [Tanacetum cinerariifolium]